MDKADTKRLWIKENGSLKPIKLQEIDWIEAMADYSCLHVGKGNHLVNQTMRQLEAKLNDLPEMLSTSFSLFQKDHFARN